MKKIGLYIHIPFCISKCAYCDFLSGPADDSVKKTYIEALCKEIKAFSEKTDYEVKSVFFGGGTPSCIDASYIKSILKVIRENYALTSDCEITIECNPGTVDESKLKTYKESGINRLSFGLQSVHDEELKAIGRIHTFNEFLYSYEIARKCDFNNINIDIISALPGQTLKKWEDTLKKVCSLKPQHISAYSLIIEENTELKRRMDSGINLNLPDEDTEREMYYATDDILSSHGFLRYEISNYSEKGKECRHNILYWRRGIYEGFGIGAASFNGKFRYRNTRDIKEYIANPIREKEDVEEILPADAMAEFMYLGMRMTGGVSMDDFRIAFGRNIFNVYGDIIEKYTKLGLILVENNKISLTKRGIDVSNVIFSEFLP